MKRLSQIIPQIIPASLAALVFVAAATPATAGSDAGQAPTQIAKQERTAKQIEAQRKLAAKKARAARKTAAKKAHAARATAAMKGQASTTYTQQQRDGRR
jgi:hypothetical protein